jgi:hypothetical protein
LFSRFRRYISASMAMAQLPCDSLMTAHRQTRRAGAVTGVTGLTEI